MPTPNGDKNNSDNARKQRPKHYVLAGLGVNLTDNGCGEIIVSFKGWPSDCVIYTKPFKGCLIYRLEHKFLDYTKIYCEDNDWNKNVVQTIISFVD